MTSYRINTILALLVLAAVGCKALRVPRFRVTTRAFGYDHGFQKLAPSSRALESGECHDGKRGETRLWSSNEDSGEEFDLMSRFVPAFFGVWALGYTVISLVDTQGGGLGDSGGYIGAGFAVVLLFALVAAAAYETFRDFD